MQTTLAADQAPGAEVSRSDVLAREKEAFSFLKALFGISATPTCNAVSPTARR